MPGMGDEMDGAMQQAPQWRRHCMETGDRAGKRATIPQSGCKPTVNQTQIIYNNENIFPRFTERQATASCCQQV
jgi:hypothetical protein